MRLSKHANKIYVKFKQGMWWVQPLRKYRLFYIKTVKMTLNNYEYIVCFSTIYINTFSLLCSLRLQEEGIAPSP